MFLAYFLKLATSPLEQLDRIHTTWRLRGSENIVNSEVRFLVLPQNSHFKISVKISLCNS